MYDFTPLLFVVTSGPSITVYPIKRLHLIKDKMTSNRRVARRAGIVDGNVTKNAT